MTNPGLLPGLIQPTWKLFRPRLRAFSASGAGITQPVLANSIITASFLREATGKVRYYGGITFGSNATFGTGETVWGIELPILANRSSNAADLPLQMAYASQGSVSNRTMVLTPTLLDPLGPYGKGGEENRWMQFFNSRLVAAGSGTIPSGSTSVTITHGLANTPTVNDIRITPTVITTNNCGAWIVDAGTGQATLTGTALTAWTGTPFDANVVGLTITGPGIPANTTITAQSSGTACTLSAAATNGSAIACQIGTLNATTFRVAVKSNPGASGFAFGWKADVDPNGSSQFDLLVARNKPWPWTAGMFIGWNVVYEGRR